MNLEAKVDTLIERFDALIARLDGQEPLKAYDRPEVPAGQAKTDGSHNADGSVWIIPTTDFSPGGGQSRVGQPTRVVYGYISPKKNPELWARGRELLGDHFEAWERQWRANPYGIYRADVRDILPVLNFVSFGYLMQPAATYVQ